MVRSLEWSISSEDASWLSPLSSSVCNAYSCQLEIFFSLISARTWCSLESSYTKPGMVVFDTRMPAWAKVSGVQILAKVPPPPSTQRLGYCESHGRCGLGSALWVAL